MGATCAVEVAREDLAVHGYALYVVVHVLASVCSWADSGVTWGAAGSQAKPRVKPRMEQ